MRNSHSLVIARVSATTRIASLSCVFFLFFLLAGCGSSTMPPTIVQPQGKLYVAVPFSPSSSNGAILRFDDPAMLSGNVTPAATIAGSQTNFGTFMGSMFLDKTNDRLFLLVEPGSTVGAILVFDHVSTKTGNVAPDRVIEGPATQMVGSGAMVVDTTRDTAYAAAGSDASGHALILVFKNASTLSGNVAPSAVLQVGTVGIGVPDLALDESGNRLFAIFNNQTVNVFDNASNLASGVLTPDRMITGANTQFVAPEHIALDPAGRLLVSQITNGLTPSGILIFANAATANGNIAPTAAINGSSTGFNITGPHAMTVVTGPGSSPSGDLYVNIEFGNVLVFKNIGTANGNVAPDHMFSVASNGTANLGLSFDNSR